MDSFLGGLCCPSCVHHDQELYSLLRLCSVAPPEGLEGFSRAEGPSVGLLKPDTLGHYQMSPRFSLSR